MQRTLRGTPVRTLRGTPAPRSARPRPYGPDADRPGVTPGIDRGRDPRSVGRLPLPPWKALTPAGPLVRRRLDQFGCHRGNILRTGNPPPGPAAARRQRDPTPARSVRTAVSTLVRVTMRMGQLETVPALDRPDLLAPAVAAALAGLGGKLPAG